MTRYKISKIKGRQVLDSRGNPTVEAQVTLENGTIGRAIVPSGASTGIYEAHEKRDQDPDVYFGKSVQRAINSINMVIQKALVGHSVLNQRKLDQMMIDLDGTPNKENLGANAILAVSLALGKAAAKTVGLPLYKYIGGVNAGVLPVPMMNIINGGMHANNSLDIQEFMITPCGASCFKEGLRWGTEIFHTLGKILQEDGHLTTVGDEGGYAPNLSSDEEALDYIVRAIEMAGYIPDKHVSICLDVAASGLFKNGVYHLESKNKEFSTDELIEYYESLISKYPIISIEDPLDESDFLGFARMTELFQNKCQIVGDDLYATNLSRLKDGIYYQSSNSILIKLNQIGTLTETLDVIELAKQSGLSTIISHRSGETEDTTIADLAVATNSGLIKTGAPSRSDRVAKYNQLLRIEEHLGNTAAYLQKSAYRI